jgi:hypothetical protein
MVLAHPEKHESQCAAVVSIAEKIGGRAET